MEKKLEMLKISDEKIIIHQDGDIVGWHEVFTAPNGNRSYRIGDYGKNPLHVFLDTEAEALYYTFFVEKVARGLVVDVQKQMSDTGRIEKIRSAVKLAEEFFEIQDRLMMEEKQNQIAEMQAAMNKTTKVVM